LREDRGLGRWSIEGEEFVWMNGGAETAIGMIMEQWINGGRGM